MAHGDSEAQSETSKGKMGYKSQFKLAEGQCPGHPTSTLSGFSAPFCVPLSLTTYTRRRRPAAIPLHRASAVRGDKRVLAKRASFRACEAAGFGTDKRQPFYLSTWGHYWRMPPIAMVRRQKG